MPYQLGPLRSSMVFSASSILPVACSDQAVSRPLVRIASGAGAVSSISVRARSYLPLLEGLRAPEKPGERVEAVDGDQAVGKIPGRLDLAVGDAEDEHALEENRIVGVAAKRRGEIGRGRLEVAGDVRASPGEVAAGEGGGIRASRGARDRWARSRREPPSQRRRHRRRGGFGEGGEQSWRPDRDR